MRLTIEVFLFIALLLDLAMIVFAVTRQDKSRSIYFAALAAALFLYTLGYLLEIMSNTPEAAMTALRIENLGIPLIAPFFTLTVLSMFYNQKVRPWMQIAFEWAAPLSGEILTYRANTSRIVDGDGKQIGWSVVMRDITDITTLMQQYEELATIDELTGVYNRRQFLVEALAKMDEAAREGLCVEWIMCDIDFFKKINDTYGHVAGDHVLRMVVNALKRQLRPYDILARYGGEEFIICTLSRNEQSVQYLASRLCRAVQDAQILFKGERIGVTASFGVVLTYPGVAFDEAVRQTTQCTKQKWKDATASRWEMKDIPAQKALDAWQLQTTVVLFIVISAQCQQH